MIGSKANRASCYPLIPTFSLKGRGDQNPWAGQAAVKWHACGPAIVALLSWLAAGALPARAQPALPPVTLLLILDASGSMWAPVPTEEVSRFASAQRVLGELLDKLPDEVEVGLIAYGHRRRGDCQDIETVVPAGPLDRAAVRRTVGALTPTGKTPLAGSAQQAFEIMRSREDITILILLTDGLETCDGDLGAVVQAARDEGLEFVLDVVGFHVDDADAQQLVDAAANGCGRYVGAAGADQLAAALDTALARVGRVSTVRDELDFAPFGGDSGRSGWRFGWQEIGENDGPGDGGEIEIEVDRTCFDGPCLNIEADAGAEGRMAAREVNLEGVDLANLSFTYGHDGDAGSEIVLEVSGDGGNTWAVLETFRLNRVVHGQRASYDLLPWAAADTRFRFRVTVAEWGDLGIDDLHLDWGVAASPGVPADSATVVDEFTFYGGNDGSRAWSGRWVENDDDHAGRGAVKLKESPNCRAQQCLKLRPDRGDLGSAIYRQADLSGAVSATLTYYYKQILVGDDAVVAEVSGDGGRTYTALETYTQDSDRSGSESFDITPFISAETRLRFRVAERGLGEGIWIDDVQIEYADPGVCTGPSPAGTGS